mgnify:CR=1 FL=1
MKNILARGGIEFLAVLVGLSGSLWIDGNVKENESIVQNNEILNRLYMNLKADSSDGEWNRKAYERGVKGSKRIIEWCDSNPTFDMVNDSIEKDISAILIATYFGNNEEEYNSLKNSGQMHLIKNKSIITDLHRYYSSLKWTDYVSNDQLFTYILKDKSEIAGYFELLFNKQSKEAEIAYFGILEEYFGKKLGGYLLSEAIKNSFNQGAKRVWVHTCSLDHENALKNYLARGMKVFKTETLIR